MVIIHLSIDVLIWCIAALSLILAVFACYLVWKRRIQVIQTRRTESYIEQMQLHWYRYFRNEEAFSAKMIPRQRYELEGVETILLIYRQHIATEASEEKIQAFANQHLAEQYKKWLQGRKWSLRLNALYRIADFRMDQLLDACKQLEEQKKKLSYEEHVQLLKIYAGLDGNRFADKLLRLPVRISEYESKRLLFNADSDVAELIQHRFWDYSLTIQCAFIEVLGLKRELQSISFLESLLKSEEPEIRIRALKAIYEIGAILDLERYTAFAESSVWEERLMTVKILLNASPEEARVYLLKLAEDESWWVRAQALAVIEARFRDRQAGSDPVSGSADSDTITLETEKGWHVK